MKCPGCDKQWWDGIGDPTFMENVKMVRSIEGLQRSGSKLFTLQFPVVGIGIRYLSMMPKPQTPEYGRVTPN